VNVDFIVVQLHWGMEFEMYPRPEQLEVAHHIAELGADAIIGHHPHVLQPVEVYHGKPILYSLGNYCHDMDHFGHEEYMAMLLRASVSDGKLTEMSILPGYLKGHGPPDYGQSPDVDRTVAYLQKVSSARGTQLELKNGSLSVPI
jgi:poly-gamma-glutamate synthesis protein (capsule biosynthesis protein)